MGGRWAVGGLAASYHPTMGQLASTVTHRAALVAPATTARLGVGLAGRLVTLVALRPA